MTIKPILFSSAMVQAILDGSKTQTRRIIKYKKIIKEEKIGFSTFTFPGEFEVRGIHENGEYGSSLFKMPISTGNILWVRETLYQNGELGLEYVADGECIDETIIPKDFNVRVDEFNHYKHCKIPSIYMPKFACRIFLEVTSVRVDRLQDISEGDAIAEGIQIIDNERYGRVFRHYQMGNQEHYFKVPELSFKSLWESINGKDSWKENPWIWVYEFKRVDKPQDF